MSAAVQQLYQVPPLMIFVAVLVIATLALALGIVIGEVEAKRYRAHDLAPDMKNRDGSLRDIRLAQRADDAEALQRLFAGAPRRDLRVRLVRREELN